MFPLPWMSDQTGHEQIVEQCNFFQHQSHLTAPTVKIKNKMSATNQILLFFCSPYYQKWDYKGFKCDIIDNIITQFIMPKQN